MRPLFDPFVLPFVISMTFVLLYCIIGMIRIVFQLPKEDRRKFLRSLIYPKSAWKNFRDLVNDCLLHTKIWKRKPLLGYMHMSIALGWFMIIIVGHFDWNNQSRRVIEKCGFVHLFDAAHTLPNGKTFDISTYIQYKER